MANTAISINTFTPSGDTSMRLNEIAKDVEQRRNELLKSNAQRAKQQTAYVKSAQAWFEMQKAEANEKKARQRFIQAAQAFSRSSHP
jgi:cell division protein ZapA (FtsZ GTPase activity inhibitor)